ncbi:hypothetical protein B0H19DRAFT_1271261 [Mycena capillaripes]|nr:hypothetical protein B0H19DRAFT_1271261 [Mycena capillaripes]
MQSDSAIVVGSPIRRVPAELLVTIFALCWDSFTPAFGHDPSWPAYDDSPRSSPEIEIARIAHAPLLDLSRVCSQWHTIALGTPSLWGDIQLSRHLWRNKDSRIETILELLQCVLERGAQSSLNVIIQSTGEDPPLRALNLLAAHCERWSQFTGGLHLLRTLPMSWKMPRLKSLGIGSWGDSLDIVQDLPSLRSLHILCDIGDERAEVFLAIYTNNFEHIPLILLMLSRLNAGAEFLLALSGEEPLQVHTPPLISRIEMSALEVDFQQSNQVSGSIFSVLSFPLLRHFRIQIGYDFYPTRWPHEQFLSLSARSSFDTHLTSLDLSDVHITEPELLESLATLSALEKLELADFRGAYFDHGHFAGAAHLRG